MSRPRPIYLLDYAYFKPPMLCRVPFSAFMEHTRLICSNEKSYQFQARILEHSGLGEETYLPPLITISPLSTNMEASRAEAKLVNFSVVDDLLARTGPKPKDIDLARDLL
ncbi:hypothetical protein M5K25_018010 [Dendrobium thyrsiflorum]|uniref:FAE domain-containing protein n=1 Tax=Dendrobium thyrsiflorum TaxID=117978 RepID=A0ABD0UHX2_DENTH